MTDMARKLQHAGHHMGVPAQELDLAAGEMRLRFDIDRRRRRRAAGAVVAALLLMGGAGLLVGTRVRPQIARAPGVPEFPVASASEQTVTLNDGSRATLLAGAELHRVSPSAGADIVLRLAAGTARFDVARQDGRVFRVLAGTVTVEVVGTSFTVERIAEGARVVVQHGRVKVAWADGQRYLDASDSGRFPPERRSTVVPIETPLPAAVPPAHAPATSPAPRSSMPRPSWRALARAGEHVRAYEALGKAGPGDVRDDPVDLLAAADVARLSGHPDEARAPLRRILSRHRDDSRAGLAAFTLGRVLLDETHEPRGAAEAFALARQLQPDSPLVEDAWARQVEALVRAGDTAEARALAQEYLSRFPAGSKAKQVRHSAGLR